MNRIAFILGVILLLASALRAQEGPDGPGWYVTETEQNHSIAVPVATAPTVKGEPLEAGDYIGVFYDSLGTLACGGFAVWDSVNNKAVTAWADDQLTQEIDGFTRNEEFKWRVWRHREDSTYIGDVIYTAGQSYFVSGGISVVGTFEANKNVDDTTDTGGGDDDYDTPPWYPTETDSRHTISVPGDALLEVFGDNLTTGDYVGVFYDSSGALACAGYQRWEEKTTVLFAYGDDYGTAVKEGMDTSEVFQWKMWRLADRREFLAHATYDLENFPNDSLFVDRGLSGITELHAYIIPDTVVVEEKALFLHLRIRFRDVMKTSSYRMIGLPGDSEINIETGFRYLFRAVPINDWVAFYDDGSANYLPYKEDTKNEFVFRPGNAFWILSHFDFRIDSTKVPRVETDEFDNYTLELNSGWNMISNPFVEPLSWEEVREYNAVVDDIHSFIDGKYKRRSAFEPYIGYYFFNRLDLASLQLPLPVGLRKAAPPAEPEKAEFLLEVRLEQDGEVLESAELGFDEHAVIELDDLDRFDPPDNFQDYNVSFNAPFEDDRWEILSRDIRPLATEGEIFDLRVKAIPGETVELTFEGIDEMGGMPLEFFHTGLQKFIDLHKQPAIRLTQPSEIAVYKIIAGSGEFLEASRKDLINNGFVLHQNYPNPFNPSTRIRLLFTEDSDVKISIFNALGERVHTASRASQPAGTLEVEWNADGNAAGIYFYSVDVTHLATGKNYREIRKMMLMK